MDCKQISINLKIVINYFSSEIDITNGKIKAVC